MSIPFDPTRVRAEYEYRCEVSDMSASPPVMFRTSWQTKDYALNTCKTLCAALPNANISMQRRFVRVENFTP